MRRAKWVERARAARTAGVPSLIDGLLKIWFTDGFAAENPPAVRYVRDRFAKTSGEGYALACEALGAADLRPLAASIKAPTLIFCGKGELPPFQDAAHWLHQNIKGCPARMAIASEARLGAGAAAGIRRPHPRVPASPETSHLRNQTGRYT